MCLITFAYRAHPRHELIFAANRDEFHHRPSRAAQFWPEATQLLAGRDELQGGTWCGITREGRIAAVTNYRDPSTLDPTKRSRGLLVRDYLLDTTAADVCAARLEKDKAKFSEFNLLIGDRAGLYTISSRSKGVAPVSPGLHAISNGLPDSTWPKMTRARSALERLLAADEVRPESIFDVLASDERAADADLPDTGIGLEMERFLSSVFIRSETYGTRCSTAILINKDGHMRFCERRFNAAGELSGETDEQFELS